MQQNDAKFTLWKALKTIYVNGNKRLNIKAVSANVYTYSLYEDKHAMEYGKALDYLYLKHRIVYHVVTFLIFPYKRHQLMEKIKKRVRFNK